MFRRHTKTRRSHSRYSLHRLKHDLRRTLWHAFDSLSNSDGLVHRSQLKVLASSIGRALGVEKCEEYIDKQEGGTDLEYPVFFEILVENLLEPLSRAPQETTQLGDSDYEEVHNVCWTLCSNKMSKRSSDTPLPDGVLYKLWRLFNFLVEVDDVYIPILPLRMHKDEIQLIARAFFEASGQMKKDFVLMSIGKDQETYSYPEFQTLFETNITKDLSDKILHHALDTVYDDYINDTLMKGMICKRGHQVKSWKDRWMVLTGGELRYYTSSDLRDMKGCITFDDDCRVEVLPEQAGHKPNRFVLHTTAKPYEMSASDIKTRNDWVSALQSVIEHCADDSFHFHQNDFIKRRQLREQLRKLRENEERLRQEEAENLKRMQQEFDDKHKEDVQRLEEQLRELEKEKREREALEARLREEAALREKDQQRLRELEALKEELERLLEEERQAKKDEEIVRALQARILEEETQKREELERLKEQHEELLKMERQKREGLEGQKEEQEELLQQAKEKLEQLEIDRMNAGVKLQEAQQKLQDAEKERIKLQDKVNLWKKPNIGLARPVQPKIDPHITHRGKGAFCEEDFHKHPKSKDADNEPVHEHITEYESKQSDEDLSEQQAKDSTSESAYEEIKIKQCQSEKQDETFHKHPASRSSEPFHDNKKETQVHSEDKMRESSSCVSDENLQQCPAPQPEHHHDKNTNQIFQTDVLNMKTDENDQLVEAENSHSFTLHTVSDDHNGTVVSENEQEIGDETSLTDKKASDLSSNEKLESEKENIDNGKEEETNIDENNQLSLQEDVTCNTSVSDSVNNENQEVHCDIDKIVNNEIIEKSSSVDPVVEEKSHEGVMYTNENEAGGGKLDEGPIYQNEGVEDNIDNGTEKQNSDGNQGVTAFDNMIYESVELKIVESGD